MRYVFPTVAYTFSKFSGFFFQKLLDPAMTGIRENNQNGDLTIFKSFGKALLVDKPMSSECPVDKTNSIDLISTTFYSGIMI